MANEISPSVVEETPAAEETDTRYQIKLSREYPYVTEEGPQALKTVDFSGFWDMTAGDFLRIDRMIQETEDELTIAEETSATYQLYYAAEAAHLPSDFIMNLRVKDSKNVKLLMQAMILEAKEMLKDSEETEEEKENDGIIELSETYSYKKAGREEKFASLDLSAIEDFTAGELKELSRQIKRNEHVMLTVEEVSPFYQLYCAAKATHIPVSALKQLKARDYYALRNAVAGFFAD